MRKEGNIKEKGTVMGIWKVKDKLYAKEENKDKKGYVRSTVNT
jgi:hypothetical protein